MKALCMSEKAMLYDQIVSLVEGGEGELLLGSSDDGAEHFELIKEALEEIERMKLEIMELRGTKTCPKCGAELADGAEFCSACGEKVSVVVDTDPEAEDVTVEEVSEEEKKEEL